MFLLYTANQCCPHCGEKKSNARFQDGEIITACQQVCPTNAINLGDLNDPQEFQRGQRLEATKNAELNNSVATRTTYLAKVKNLEPAIALSVATMKAGGREVCV